MLCSVWASSGWQYPKEIVETYLERFISSKHEIILIEIQWSNSVTLLALKLDTLSKLMFSLGVSYRGPSHFLESLCDEGVNLENIFVNWHVFVVIYYWLIRVKSFNHRKADLVILSLDSFFFLLILSFVWFACYTCLIWTTPKKLGWDRRWDFTFHVHIWIEKLVLAFLVDQLY